MLSNLSKLDCLTLRIKNGGGGGGGGDAGGNRASKSTESCIAGMSYFMYLHWKLELIVDFRH